MIMNILEVQDLCKTYGTGETEVHALNHISFPSARENSLRLSGNPVLEKYAAECSGCAGQCDIRQGSD